MGLDQQERRSQHRQGMAWGVAVIAALAIIGAVIAVTSTFPGSEAISAETVPNPAAELSAKAAASVTSTDQPMSPLAACDEFIAGRGENWTTARAGTVTAGELVAWQEQLASASDIGLRSRYRERPVSEELTVCLYWGHVSAPGVPPVDGASRTPYNASLWVITSDGSGHLEAAGTKENQTMLPSDANSS